MKIISHCSHWFNCSIFENTQGLLHFGNSPEYLVKISTKFADFFYPFQAKAAGSAAETKLTDERFRKLSQGYEDEQSGQKIKCFCFVKKLRQLKV